MLEGVIGGRGKCEYTFLLTQGTMVLLIELKQNITALNDESYSKFVAQVLAEADGMLPLCLPLIVAASVYNATKDLDTAPIQVILTDSLRWDFFYFDFSNMHVYRGKTQILYGYKSDGDNLLLIPSSEKDVDHVLRLKAGNIPPHLELTLC